MLLASEVLSEMAMLSGLDVKKSEVHGMAKRGGVVFSHVRFGSRVWSPTIPKGEADVVVALEWAEGLRWLPYLRSDRGTLVADTTTNAQGQVVGFVLSGFSFHQIRDTRPRGYLARFSHLGKIINWLGNLWFPGLGADPTKPVNSLAQDYSNLFNPTTTICFDVKEACRVVLNIYNLLGEKILNLVDEQYQPGQYHVPFNAVEFESGIYFYHISLGNYQAVRKMVILE